LCSSDDIPPVDNPALTTALKAFASLTREQKAALSGTLDGFVSCLAPTPTDLNQNPQSLVVLTEKAWHNRANWGSEAWDAWETWGWYRQFCRSVRFIQFLMSCEEVAHLVDVVLQYAPYLRNYSATLTTISFTKLEGLNSPAVEMLKKTLNVAIGQEA
jgi:nuclear cap-binding protein subunit 1